MIHGLSRPKNQIRWLLLEGISPTARAVLEKHGYTNVEVLSGALEKDALIDKLQGVQMLGIRSRTQVTEEVLEAAKSLVAVGCFSVGTNQVDLKGALTRGIPVFNAPFSNTRSVAELTVAEIVMLMRGVFPKSTAAHEGRWMKSAAGSHEVRGKTLGIVGYGNIGTQLSNLAEAMGLRVIYFDLVDKLQHGNVMPSESLDGLLAESDVVSLHVPDTPETRDMFGADQISKMKKGAFLINNARGKVVDIDALAAALKSGHLAGAAIDVFPVEPKSNKDEFLSPLRGLDNVILTPHVGGSTQEAQEEIGHFVANKLAGFAHEGRTELSVNLPAVIAPQLQSGTRVGYLHHNVPGVLAEVNQLVADSGANVTGQYLATTGEQGYVVTDVDGPLPQDVLATLGGSEHCLWVRGFEA